MYPGACSYLLTYLPGACTSCTVLMRRNTAELKNKMIHWTHQMGLDGRRYRSEGWGPSLTITIEGRVAARKQIRQNKRYLRHLAENKVERGIYMLEYENIGMNWEITKAQT